MANHDPLAGLNLRDTIRALKGLNGWSNSDMAIHAGCKHSNVSSYLTGNQEMSLGKVEKMLNGLGYEIRIVKKES